MSASASIAASALRGAPYLALSPRIDELLGVPAGAFEEPIHALGQIGRPLVARRDDGSFLAAQSSDCTSRNADRALADPAMREFAILDQLAHARKADIE